MRSGTKLSQWRYNNNNIYYSTFLKLSRLKRKADKTKQTKQTNKEQIGINKTVEYGQQLGMMIRRDAEVFMKDKSGCDLMIEEETVVVICFIMSAAFLLLVCAIKSMM